MAKNRAAAALGALGGKKTAKKLGADGMAKLGRKGARRRDATLSPEERSEIAKRAAEARWKKHKK